MNVYLVYDYDDVYGHDKLIDIFSTEKEAKKFIKKYKEENPYHYFYTQCWKVKEKWDE